MALASVVLSQHTTDIAFAVLFETKNVRSHQLKEEGINAVLRHSLNTKNHSPKINMVGKQVCDVGGMSKGNGRGLDESLYEVMTPEKGHGTIVHYRKEVLVMIFGA